MTTDTAAPANAPTSLDIRTLSHTTPLARDYAWDFTRLAAFFSGDPARPDAWRELIPRVLGHPVHDAAARRRLAAILADQQAARGAPAPARAAAASLGRTDTVTVVTGQQAGLFGGPIYTLLKAASAIAIARRVEQEFGTPAVPVFWVDVEDHDWAEVRSCAVLTAEDTVATASVPDLPGAGSRPVGQLTLEASIADVFTTLEQALPPTPFTADVLAALREAYRPGTGYGRACAAWIESVLGPHGLVVFESDDPAAKALVAPLLAREAATAPRTSRLAAEAGRALTALGYHAQVQPAEDAAALFSLAGGRESVSVGDGSVRVGGSTVAREEFAAQVTAAPEAYGPNVLLRPLVQDTLFPTVCYVAGPGELAYLAQLKAVYDAHDVPMPLVQPRASATFLDSNAARFMARHRLGLETFAAQDERALNDLLAAQLPAEVDASAEDAATGIARLMDALAAVVPAVDATLEGAVRSSAGRMQDDLKKLRGKILQAAKRKDETLRRQYRHTQVQSFPDGGPQERQLGLVVLLNRVGPALVDRLLSDVPPVTGHHWLVTL